LNLPKTWDYWLLWFVALISLALNVVLINVLLGARRQAGEAAAAAAQAIGALRQTTIDTSVRVERSIPVILNIPISQTLTVPIDDAIPINTQVQVPIEIPLLGTRLFDIPIQATIPVKLETVVPINLIVPLSTSVPVAFDVPIRIVIADTPLGESLAETQAYFENAAHDLQASPLSGPAPTLQP
jgi:hypothetical protein